MGRAVEEVLSCVEGSETYRRELEALLLSLEERAEASRRWNNLSWVAFRRKIIGTRGQGAWDEIIARADLASMGRWVRFDVVGVIPTTKSDREASHARAQIGMQYLLSAFAQERDLADCGIGEVLEVCLRPICLSMVGCLDRIGGFCRVMHDLSGSAKRVVAMSAVAASRGDEELALRLVRFATATWAQGLIPLDIGRIGGEYRFQLLSR